MEKIQFKGPVCKIEHHVMVRRHLFSDVPLDLKSIIMKPRAEPCLWTTVDNVATSLQVDLLFKQTQM